MTSNQKDHLAKLVSAKKAAVKKLEHAVRVQRLHGKWPSSRGAGVPFDRRCNLASVQKGDQLNVFRARRAAEQTRKALDNYLYRLVEDGSLLAALEPPYIGTSHCCHHGGVCNFDPWDD